MTHVKNTLLTRTAYGVVVGLTCYLVPVQSSAFMPEQGGAPLYPSRQTSYYRQQPQYQPAPQPRYQQNIDGNYAPPVLQGYDAYPVEAPLYPERCDMPAGGELPYEFPVAMPQQAPYPAYQEPYPMPAPQQVGTRIIKTSTGYPTAAQGGYPQQYYMPEDELPVFRAYNTIETQRNQQFDRSQAYAPAPRISPAPSYTQQAPVRDFYGGSPRARAPEPQYYEPEYPPVPEPRVTDYYRRSTSPAPFSEPALQPFEEFDSFTNEQYHGQEAPSYTPAYPGAAAYPAPYMPEEPRYSPQAAPRQPYPSQQTQPHPRSLPNGAYAPTSQPQSYGQSPYAPPVNQPYFDTGRALSSEARKILNRLPHNIDTPKQERMSRVDVERVEPSVPGMLADEEMDNNEGARVSKRKAKYNVEIELEKAYEALVSGQTQVAISIYQDILKRHKRNEDALFGLATTYHRNGDLQAALPIYGRLLKIAPEHREALNNFLVLVAEESETDALRELEILEKQNPDFSPIPAQLAILYDSLGQPDAARKKMVRAIRLEPDNLVYKYNLAVMLDKHGRGKDAMSLYRELLNAARKGKALPASAENIKERLDYLRSENG